MSVEHPEPEDTIPPLARTDAGSALMRLRVTAGLSVRAAAEIADVSTSYLQRVERGRTAPTLGFVARIMAALAGYITAAPHAAAALAAHNPTRPPLRRRVDVDEQLRGNDA